MNSLLEHLLTESGTILFVEDMFPIPVRSYAVRTGSLGRPVGTGKWESGRRGHRWSSTGHTLGPEDFHSQLESRRGQERTSGVADEYRGSDRGPGCTEIDHRGLPLTRLAH
jgi:hypothetical protein